MGETIVAVIIQGELEIDGYIPPVEYPALYTFRVVVCDSPCAPRPQPAASRGSAGPAPRCAAPGGRAPLASKFYKLIRPRPAGGPRGLPNSIRIKQVEFDVNLDAPNIQGTTALHEAAFGGHSDIVAWVDVQFGFLFFIYLI